MSRMFLIARQEFVKFVTRRGFLFTLIGVPVWIALAAIVPAMLSQGADRAAFAVVDSSGVFRQQIEQTLAPNTNDPDSPARDFVLLPTPPDLASAASGNNFAAVARDYLVGSRKIAIGGNVEKLDAIVVVPPDFGNRPAQFWATSAQPHLQDFVQMTLTKALRLRAANRLGDAKASAALSVEADVERQNPVAGTPSAILSVASIGVSVGMAIMLLIVAMMNSMALLQGVIEEKSTRMIEVLLSCATPWQIVGGKIAGVIAMALFTVILWLASAALLGLFFAGAGAHLIAHAALGALANPVLLPMIVFYFVCGLLIYGAIFLAIGSMSASLADAQAYLGPSMMMIMLPNLFIGSILRAPNGVIAVAASYFPVYTPYIMLLRIGAHPPVVQLVTTALLTLAVTSFLVWKSGDIFARHALTTEKPPRIGTLFRRNAKA